MQWQCLSERACFTLPMPTWASCRAREGGYSAVSVLRYTPCSFTPARACIFELLQPNAHDLEKALLCMQASTHTRAHWRSRSIWKLASSSQDMADGAQMPTPPFQTTALNTALPRSWMVLLSSNFLRCAGERPGTPSMRWDVLKALGPPGRSLSLQGGASIIRATIPDQQVPRRLRHPGCYAQCHHLGQEARSSQGQG